MIRGLFITGLLLSAFVSKTEVRLPSIFIDGAVLQRDAPINIWGWASSGESVRIIFQNRTYNTTAGATGEWKLILAPQQAGGPYQMIIQGKNKLLLNDLLIGDVWIASGQSNMEYELYNVKDLYQEEIEKSTNNFIRQFTVEKEYSFEPQKDLRSKGWKAANPSTVLSYSAVAYFFAADLYAKNRVPIGIINTSWGGTPAEAWTSLDALQPFPNYTSRYDYIRQPAHIEKAKARVDSVRNAYKNALDVFLNQDTTGISCSSLDFNVTDWQKMKLPALWEGNGLPGNYDGLVWFRKELEIPVTLSGKEAVLELSYIDDIDNTYVNGQLVGSSIEYNKARKYTIPAGVLRAGKNVISVKVMDTGGGGGIYGNGELKLTIGSQVFALNTEWHFKAFNHQPLPTFPWMEGTLFMHYEPTTLYNAMLAPLIPYCIKGVIWYQGEANVTRAAEYEKLFPNMIADWRKHFGQGNFPFLFVQLANYEDKYPGVDWPSLRMAQTNALTASPNTAMVVTIDIGDRYDIHPKNKKDVGLRLALAAQRIAYGRQVVFSGPIYKSHELEGNKIVIRFNHAGGGLVSHGGDLRRFEIAAADGQFVKAKAIIRNDQVIVWNDSIGKPEMVRYAWAASPDGCNLYNREGLPASPFCTSKKMLENEIK